MPADNEVDSDSQPNRSRDQLPLGRRDYLQYTGAAAIGLAATGGAAAQSNDQDNDEGKLAATALQADYEHEPNNLQPDQKPRLFWTVPQRMQQGAYRLLVADSASALRNENGNIWDSGRVDSTQSTSIEYEGSALEADTTYHWMVRIWGEEESVSGWSEPASFTTALPDAENHWEGEWIGVNSDRAASLSNAEQNYPAALHDVETLGQSFTIDGTFEKVSGRFPTWSSDNSSLTLSLYEDGPNGDRIIQKRFENIEDNTWITLEFEDSLSAGTYYLEQSEAKGTVGWWSHTDDVLTGGQAYENGEPVDGDRTLRVGQTDKSDPSPLLRTNVEFGKQIESARAHVVTLGYGELHVNGERIGDEQLNPAWTKYDDRVLYSTHDLTDVLKEGANALGLWLGRGWYAKGKEELPSRIPSWEAFGPPRGLLQLNVTYQDGTTESVTTDESWAVAHSPIEENDIYDGETYDARKEQAGWSTPNFDSNDWNPASIVDSPSDDFALHPQRLQPIQATETIEPKTISKRGDEYIVDFGQNHAGWVELTVTDAEDGDEIIIKHAEVVDEEGYLVTENLRSAEATDTYIANGDGEEIYEPRFTYHGFRYARIIGYPGELTEEDIHSKVIHTGFEQTGSFACSNNELNQVQHNAVWGLRSNAMGHPTDCCQRDERFGWTGDVHQNARADFYNFDAFRYHEKWMRDHDDDQDPDGSQSDAIPHAVDWGYSDPNWAKTRVITPWYMYLHTGDKRVLADRYDGMRDYVDFWDDNAQGHVVPASMAHYGDWLAFEPPRSDPALFNTFAHYQTTNIFAKMATVLDRDVAAEYRERSDAIAAAFNDEFFDSETKSYGSGTQTTYALPLSVGIVPDEHEQTVVENLVEKVRTEDEGKLQTGFIGTRPLLNTLVDHGYVELAYNIVSQPEQPGWVYMVRNGATTMWERWDSDEQIGSGMNSFNHRPWTLVSEWFYRKLAGIDAAEPGFQTVEIAPVIPNDLDWAEGSVDTVRGEVASRWERTETPGHSRTRNGLMLETSIPGNTTGTVRVPTLGGEKVRVRESRRTIWTNGNQVSRNHPGVRSVEHDGDAVVVEVGSGDYEFELEQLGKARK